MKTDFDTKNVETTFGTKGPTMKPTQGAMNQKRKSGKKSKKQCMNNTNTKQQHHKHMQLQQPPQ